MQGGGNIISKAFSFTSWNASLVGILLENPKRLKRIRIKIHFPLNLKAEASKNFDKFRKGYASPRLLRGTAG